METLKREMDIRKVYLGRERLDRLQGRERMLLRGHSAKKLQFGLLRGWGGFYLHMSRGDAHEFGDLALQDRHRQRGSEPRAPNRRLGQRQAYDLGGNLTCRIGKA